MKIWEKGIETNKEILDFTIGDDQELDLLIAESDIVASIAHVKMLSASGLLENEEEKQINLVLMEQFERVAAQSFSIDKDVEDIHSQLEKTLIQKLGDTGKKVHTARSRNDQVMTALKLYYRQELSRIAFQIKDLISVLLDKAEKTSEIMLPGYTHLQVAMYSSFGLWFSAWAEAFTEDLFIVGGTMDYINQNPLGSAAGYGSSFPIDRDLTTKLLAFKDMHINSINAQLSRGKTEKFLMSSLSAVAGDLSKMAMDLVLFLNQNFDFVYLNDELTTGSSIMPHKKNPDVLELLRAKANRVQTKYIEVQGLINNLPSGYHRDFQLLKDICFPAIEELKICLKIMTYLIPAIHPREKILDKEIYKYIGSVDSLNEKVRNGLSFRDAYREIADEIREGKYKPVAEINHSHIGSIGNLSLDRISDKMNEAFQKTRAEEYIDFNMNFCETCKKEYE